MKPPLGPLDEVDLVYRAIAHPGRRTLLTRLGRAGGLTLGELSDGQAMTRQAVSQHLAQLEQAGIVTTRRHGREKLHYLNPGPLLHAHEAWLEPLLTPAARTLAGMATDIEAGRTAEATQAAEGAGPGEVDPAPRAGSADRAPPSQRVSGGSA